MAETPQYRFTLTSGADGVTALASMDPRLQRLVALRQRGMRKPSTAATSENEVAVIAKVTDLEAWEGMSEVVPGSVIGDPGEDGSVLVTARIPVSRIEQVRKRPFVKSLKAAQRLHRTLAATTEEILARPARLPKGSKSAGGRGVVVGIVDIGCDFAHRNFRTASGRTRLKSLWDQWGSAGGNAEFDYGTFYSPAQINAALKKANPYAALGYGPEASEPAHGTHVMDIAAGNGRGSGVPGVAPAADLVFVEVANSDIPWEGFEAVGSSFGDSVQLLEALKYIFDTAGTRPCSVNVSLGTNGGPHDGTTLVEQGIDRLLRQAPNRAVVIAASNSFGDGIHATGKVPQSAQFDLAWAVAPGDETDNEMEIWYPGASRLGLEIIAPDGTSLGTVPPGQSGTVSTNGEVMVFAASRLNDPNNGDNMIGVFLHPSAPSGQWTMRLRGDPSAATAFHAWIERDDAGQSVFPGPDDTSFTIGSISCGHESIAVGSYDAHKTSLPLSWFSSAGPTRDGRQKPEVSAPGHSVVAAKSRSQTGVTRMSGTSMAAPAVTGAVALMLAAARARKKSLPIDAIRKAVIDGARKNPPATSGWDPRYGQGRISAAAMVASAVSVVPIAKKPKAAKSKPAAKPKARRTKRPPQPHRPVA